MEEQKDIDDLIRELQNDTGEDAETDNDVPSVEKSGEVAKIDSKDVDVTENEEVMKAVFEMTLEDRKKADDAYEIFAPEVAKGTDRSTASKEAMMRAIELKIASAKNIIDMMKLNKKDGPSVGVFMGDLMGEKKAGISLKNISDEIDD